MLERNGSSLFIQRLVSFDDRTEFRYNVRNTPLYYPGVKAYTSAWYGLRANDVASANLRTNLDLFSGRVKGVISTSHEQSCQ